MSSRREFLTVLGAAAGASLLGPARALARAPAITSALGRPIGLQLWSLRTYLPKDLPGTLARVRGFGFEEVEGAGLWGHTAADLRAALDAAGLRCPSAHIDYDRLRNRPDEAFAEARTLGATTVVCPWLEHKGAFTRDAALAASDAFNSIGKAAAAAGLHFAYHCHGYEFVPAAEGTLFDTLAGATEAAAVGFQVDVFHAFLGGADPAALITRYAPRVASLHLKDLKKGFPVKVGTAIAPAEADVPVGSGQIDMAAVLTAAKAAGVANYYIEDESSDPLAHIPQSVTYLEHVTLGA
jgi:sugar phosphate isomerase/epimerase